MGGIPVGLGGRGLSTVRLRKASSRKCNTTPLPSRGRRARLRISFGAVLVPLPGPDVASAKSDMKRIFEIDPLLCPRCKGTMRIVAFLTSEREILKIADSLRIPRAQAPPKIPRASQQEFFDQLPQDDFA